MSVTVRPYRRGGWEVDLIFRLPNGQRHRERSKAPVSSKSAAKRWGEDRERHLVQHGLPKPTKEVPTLEEFAPRFLADYAVANRQKPSGIAAKRTILGVHLVPALGAKPLDGITNEDIQRLKHKLTHKAPKTVNNVLTVLSVLLKKGVEWGLIDRVPCVIKLVRTPKCAPRFHDFGEYKQLVAAATAIDEQTTTIVLLGGEAGLRLGEMLALEWRDVDLVNRRICIERSDWRGHVTSPKGGRLRHVLMTKRLLTALRKSRHLRSDRILCDSDGTPLNEKMMQNIVARAAKRANVKHHGVHVLRHTFCSHLAMRGAPARAIQELAGHESLMTTQRYMHLSPVATEMAIALLDRGVITNSFGDMLETAPGQTAK